MHYAHRSAESSIANGGNRRSSPFVLASAEQLSADASTTNVLTRNRIMDHHDTFEEAMGAALHWASEIDGEGWGRVPTHVSERRGEPPPLGGYQRAVLTMHSAIEAWAPPSDEYSADPFGASEARQLAAALEKFDGETLERVAFTLRSCAFHIQDLYDEKERMIDPENLPRDIEDAMDAAEGLREVGLTWAEIQSRAWRAGIISEGETAAVAIQRLLDAAEGAK
jgi:hypothetical protein